MGKASRTKVDSSRREKIAAQRAAARRAEQRRRILIALGAVVVVLAIVVAFVVIKLNSKTAADNSPNGPTGAALASVVSNVTSGVRPASWIRSRTAAARSPRSRQPSAVRP